MTTQPSFLLCCLVLISLLSCQVQSRTSQKCGLRSWSTPLNNASQSSAFNLDSFRAFPDSFPWIVKLVLQHKERKDQHLLLCTGAAISDFVALFPAHCVSGNEINRLRIVQNQRQFDVENAIVHPDFIFKHPSFEHDLVLLKIRSNSGFAAKACLPEFDEDPVENCQVATYFPDESNNQGYSILSHWLAFGPSEACMETPHLRGYINSSLNILCSTEDRCQTFVQVR